MMGLRGAALHLTKRLTDAAILLAYPCKELDAFLILWSLEAQRWLIC